MSEYIMRSDALALAREYYSQGAKEKAVPVTAIRNIPSADVTEVRHGEWLLDVYAKDSKTGHEYTVFKCSECGCGCVSRNNFCHNCGADMRMDGGT